MSNPSPITLSPRSEDAIKLAGLRKRAHPELPLDLLADSARRLKILCLILFVVTPLSTLVRTLTSAPGAGHDLQLVGLFLACGASLGLYLAVQRQWIQPLQVGPAGSAYVVLIAAVTALVTVPGNWFGNAPPPLSRWSSVAVWVLIAQVVVPGPTRRAVLTAGLGVAMEPLGIVLYHTLGLGPLPPASSLIQIAWLDTLAAVLSVIVSRTIYGLGEKVAAARSVGKYQLTTRLGAGGMGEVWKAQHRMLARPAAVKLIGPKALGDADVPLIASLFQRFEREAQATAALSSPHTISVYDFGIAQDGTFYYVMELLDGLDLHTLVTRHGPQPPERVVHLLRQACHSLAEAHARGVVHRDIKPANIFICRYGLDLDFVKVLDFGLVREMQPVAPTHLTHPDAIVGTPAFLSPESISGEWPVDGRSDIYGLGCVAYYLLAGLDVFLKPNAMALMAAHLRDRPDAISKHASVPPALEEVVMACLEKNPADRPQTGTALSQRLAALGLEALWTPERAAEWWNRYHPAPPSSSSAPTEPL